jgi:hypothetical protein
MKYTVLIGGARAQKLSSLVCEYSILRRTKLALNIVHTFDGPVPEPASVHLRSRTGFSFCRFMLPEAAGREGVGVYLDSDMILLSDIAELFSLMVPEGPPILCTSNLPSVIVVDCQRVGWDVGRILGDLDRKRWTYEQLLGLQAFEKNVGRTIKDSWNSLDKIPFGTKLLHYTDMSRQCWRTMGNHRVVDNVWKAELKDAMSSGAIKAQTVSEERTLKHVVPTCLPLEVVFSGKAKP